MAFDILLLAAPKDYPKLPFALEAIGKNVEGYEGIYLSTPAPFDVSRLPLPVQPLLDVDVLQVEQHRWRFRPNWMYQQFIKLFQEVTPNDMYFVVDADTIINKPLPLFEGTTPIWWVGRDQMHPPYFRFSETMLGIGRTYHRSFIADMFFFSRSMVHDMLAYGGYTVGSFIERSYEVVDDECYVSEAEMYMNYVCTRHPEAYAIRELRTTSLGKSQADPYATVWSSRKVSSMVKRMRSTDYQTFSLHSWCSTSHDWSVGPEG